MAAIFGNQGNARQRERYLQQQPVTYVRGTAQNIFMVNNSVPLIDPGHGPYDPIRQSSPVDLQMVNYNLASNRYFDTSDSTHAVLGLMLTNTTSSSDGDGPMLMSLLSPSVSKNLLGTMVYPIFDMTNASSSQLPVGHLLGLISWPALFTDALPSHTGGMVVVVENSCHQQYTLQLDGSSDVILLGMGDLHDHGFDGLQHIFSLEDLNVSAAAVAAALPNNPMMFMSTHSNCQYQLHIFPSSSFQDHYVTNAPAIYASITVVIFVVALLVFALYDYIVERRNKTVLKSALEARAIFRYGNTMSVVSNCREFWLTDLVGAC